MTIIKSVLYTTFGDPRSRDGNLGTLKPKKNCRYCLENLLFSYNYNMGEPETLKFEHYLGAERLYAN